MSHKERIRLPIDSDLSMSSVLWAVSVLGQPPVILWVTPEDNELATKLFGDIEIGISEALGQFAWELEGATRIVYSNGA